MRIEEVVGRNMERLRLMWPKSQQRAADVNKVYTLPDGSSWSMKAGGRVSQTDLGFMIGLLTGEPWSRQAVSAAERGDRAFTLRDLLIIAFALRVPYSALLELPPDEKDVEISGRQFTARQLQGVVYPDEDTRIRSQMVPVVRSLTTAEQEMRAALDESKKALQRAAKILEGKGR